jgi:Recombination endonuclease VII
MKSLETKVCTKCKKEKPITDFYVRNASYDGRACSCKACDNKRVKNRDYMRNLYAKNREHFCEVQRTARAKDPERFRGYEIKKRFKMSMEDFNRRLEEQGGCCAICGAVEPGARYNQWHIDHDRNHCNGRKSCGLCVRGILCHYCNTTLGNAKDSPDRLRKAADYLDKHAKTVYPVQGISSYKS